MKGDWIQTYTGKKFYPLDPRPEDICIEDIAHSLANTCRYNGHSKKFYSVAQHSVIMSYAPIIGDPRWFLMHDAAEAYISDVPRPIKPMLAEFKSIENMILGAVAEKFNLGNPNHPSIRHADAVMLATEKRDVLNTPVEWEIILPKPLEEIIYPWTPTMAEELFLDCAKKMGILIL